MEEQIRELFRQGADCGQVVLSRFAQQYGMSEEMAYRVAAGFGGGMYVGETCGAVTGAYMVIGLKHGHTGLDDVEQKAHVNAACQEFRKKFEECYGSCICREILGYDLSKPGVLEEVIANGRMMEVCPGAVAEAIHILEKMAAER